MRVKVWHMTRGLPRPQMKLWPRHVHFKRPVAQAFDDPLRTCRIVGIPELARCLICFGRVCANRETAATATTHS